MKPRSRASRNLAEKTAWYFNRLKKMPLQEIPWRIQEKLKKLSDRNRRFTPPAIACAPAPTIFRLCDHLSPELLNTRFPDMCTRHMETADHTLENRHWAFGTPARITRPADWCQDPVTGTLWPDKFWGDIDYRDKAMGGVKFVWEINRLYPLFSLGIAFRVTKEARYARHLLSMIRSWTIGNPYPIGVNWVSAMEAGIRLANLVWALSLLDGYEFSDRETQWVSDFIWFNAIRLMRYPSRFSSSNNHLIAEGFGLFTAGLYFPELPDARNWMDTGKQILEAEVGRQILADGGSFEYTTTYLSFVLDFFLLYRLASRQNGLTCSDQLESRIEASCDFIRTIMDEKGNIPNIGDQDSAVVIGFGLSNLENFTAIRNTGAHLFQRPGLSTGEPDFKTWVLTGAYEALPCPKQAPGAGPGKARMLGPSGLAVVRDVFQDHRILFIGNGSPMGLPPLYAHGHLDALSFTLSIDGYPVFVDPGTYRYHDGGKWRTYFRSTAAHNTFRINQKELSRQPGDFMFGTPYAVIENRLETNGHRTVWHAAHNVYPGAGRQVSWDAGSGEFTITDHFPDVPFGETPAHMELFFHLHPDFSVRPEGREIRISNGTLLLRLYPDNGLDIKVHYGSTQPLLGWYSPEFNQLHKTHTICCAGRPASQTGAVTRIRLEP